MIDTNAVEQRIKECLRNGNQQFKAKAKISKIVYMNNATRLKGKAVCDKEGNMYIALSKHYLEKEFDWMLKEIIPHEVAHIICFWLHDHGKEGANHHEARWVEVAQALGSSGNPEPPPPETYARNDRYHYKSSTGNDLYLSRDKHDIIQNQLRTFTDNRDGGRITASSYMGQ